ncbi:MAG: NAD(P)-dependent oxidoreductase [Verrucomicrobiota bacterium]|nr:NAD(P)-dependent oxidoreductase [Verrucomicrobiota bacterium]
MAQRVGIMGVGLLGGALGHRLAKRGWEVLGHDRAVPAADGLTMCANATELAVQCDTILLSLPTSDITAGVVVALGQAVTQKHCFIDTTTGEPGEMEALGQALARRAAAYLEANVAGSSELAKRGEATLFLGGSTETIDRCQTLLEALAAKRFHVGPVGAASRFKLVHNLILGLNRAALAEGLAFAEALGFDAADAVEILRDTPATSAALEAKGGKMAKADYEPPQARLAQHLKDVRLIRQLADAAGANTPLSSVHQSLLERAEALGLGESDNAAVIEALRSGNL